MIVIDPAHISGVDFNISNIYAVQRTRSEGTDRRYADRGRPDHGLCLISDGKIVYIDADGKSVEAQRGDVIYLPRGKRYTAVCGKGESVSDLLVNFMLSDELGRELALSDDIFRLAEGADDDLVGQFSNLASCCVGAGSIMTVKMQMFALLEGLLAQEKNVTLQDMESCVSYINAHYAEIGDVSALARMCGLGETAFRKHFRAHMGMSPVHYLNAVKVERACRMLCSGEATPAHVCESLGFYDVAYFHKVFKKYTGKTPGEYVRACAEGEVNP